MRVMVKDYINRRMLVQDNRTHTVSGLILFLNRRVLSVQSHLLNIHNGQQSINVLINVLFYVSSQQGYIRQQQKTNHT